MSTKIYSGAKIESNILFYVEDTMRRMKEEMLVAVEADYRRVYARCLCQMAYYLNGNPETMILSGDIDPAKYDGKTTTNLSFWLVRQFRELVNKNQSTALISDTCFDVDFDFNVSLLPLPDKTLLIPFGENVKCQKIFQKYTQEYGYWNNCDKPDGISDEEWEQRRHDWDIVLPGIGVPRENGPVRYLVDSKNIVKYIPFEEIKKDITDEMNSRVARKIAKNSLVDNEFNRLYIPAKAQAEKEGRSLDMSDTSRLFRIASENISEEDIKRATEHIIFGVVQYLESKN